MESIIITATLGSDILRYGDDPMMLDGPLQWSACMAMPEEERPGVGKDFAMPVGTWSCPDDGKSHESVLNEEGRIWGWQVSRVYAKWMHRHPHRFRKKPPLAALRQFSDAKSVNIAAGAYKGVDLAFEGVWADHVTWYAFGDRNGVAELLERVTHLGKKHNLGWGRVKAWTVESGPGDIDWETMRWTTGGRQLVRPMPVLWTHAVDADGPALRRSVRPPYWLPSRLVTCVGVRDES